MNFLKELSIEDQVVIHENESEDAIFSITKKTKLVCITIELVKKKFDNL
jgi:hypothetical protein